MVLFRKTHLGTAHKILHNWAKLHFEFEKEIMNYNRVENIPFEAFILILGVYLKQTKKKVCAENEWYSSI